MLALIFRNPLKHALHAFRRSESSTAAAALTTALRQCFPLLWGEKRLQTLLVALTHRAALVERLAHWVIRVVAAGTAETAAHVARHT